MLKGEKVLLRSVEPEDTDLIFEWENNRDIWHVSNTVKPFSRAMIKAYAESDQDVYAQKQLRLIIEHKETNKEMGCVDLYDFDPTHDRAGVGILIADKKYRNKGFASEAVGLIIDYAFFTLNLHQLHCAILTDNTDSLKLFQKHGFQIIGEKEDWIKEGTQFKNEFTLQLINRT